MGLTLQNLRDRLRGSLGVTEDDSPIGDDTSIDLLLNESWWEIADIFKFREKETSRTDNTVAGTAAISVATDLLGLQAVAIKDRNSSQYTPLPEMTIHEYNNNFVDTTSSRGKPTHYVRKGSQIILYPTPDNVYVIRSDYWKTLSDIASGGPNIPQSWHTMIWMNAAFLGHAQNSDMNKAYAMRKLAGLPSVADTKESTETKEKENRPYAAVQMLRRPYP